MPTNPSPVPEVLAKLADWRAAICRGGKDAAVAALEVVTQYEAALTALAAERESGRAIYLHSMDLEQKLAAATREAETLRTLVVPNPFVLVGAEGREDDPEAHEALLRADIGAWVASHPEEHTFNTTKLATKLVALGWRMSVPAPMSEVARLVDALKPFAHFGAMYAARPIGGERPDTMAMYSIHTGTAWEADLTRGDFKRAVAALAPRSPDKERAP